MVRFPRYNLSRFVADARVPLDKSHYLNHTPFTPGAFQAWKQKMKGFISHGSEFYATVWLMTFGTGLYRDIKTTGDPSSRFQRRSSHAVTQWVEADMGGNRIGFSQAANANEFQPRMLRDWSLDPNSIKN